MSRAKKKSAPKKESIELAVSDRERWVKISRPVPYVAMMTVNASSQTPMRIAVVRGELIGVGDVLASAEAKGGNSINLSSYTGAGANVVVVRSVESGLPNYGCQISAPNNLAVATGEEIVGETNVLSGIKVVIDNRHASGRVKVRWKNKSQVVRTLTIEPQSSANALENATEVIVMSKSEAGHNFVITVVFSTALRS